MKISSSIIFLYILILSGCGEDTSNSLLIDKVWKLSAIRFSFDDGISIDDPDKYTIEFKEDGRVSIQADCNTCGAEYDTVGDSISIAMIGCTKVGCGENSFGTEYVNALRETVAFEIFDNKLLLIFDDGNLVFD